MNSVGKREIRAAEYRRLATAAETMAEASQLAHVREKHEQAAAQWTALAMIDERPASVRVAQQPKHGPASPDLTVTDAHGAEAVGADAPGVGYPDTESADLEPGDTGSRLHDPGMDASGPLAPAP